MNPETASKSDLSRQEAARQRAFKTTATTATSLVIHFTRRFPSTASDDRKSR